MSNNRTLLNTPDAAQFLDLRPGTLEVWRTYGKGPKFVKIGRAVKYRLQDLEDYLDQAVRNSTSEYHGKRG
jgi:predicted DNA-binding transcriptional regulator AlpA